MKKSIILINIVLILCMVGLTYKLYLDWERWQQDNSIERLMKRVRTQVPDLQVPELRSIQRAIPQTDVKYVSDNNLFHKDRNMLLPQDIAAATPVIKLENPPLITGVMELDGKKFVQVKPEKGGGGRSMRLAEGDKWETDWTVASIQEDRIVLTALEQKEEVLFNDPNRRRSQQPKPAQTARTASAPGSGVWTIGGSGAGRGSAPPRTTAAASSKPADITAAASQPARNRFGGTDPGRASSLRRSGTSNPLSSRTNRSSASQSTSRSGSTSRSNLFGGSNPKK